MIDSYRGESKSIVSQVAGSILRSTGQDVLRKVRSAGVWNITARSSSRLAVGDLRSNGLANEVAERVLKDPRYCEVLIALLDDPDDVIQGRVADVIEKVARERPDLFVDRLADLITAVKAIGSRWLDGIWR
jgi:hypothetical protein